MRAEERETFGEVGAPRRIGRRTALSVLSGMAVVDLAGAGSRPVGVRLRKVAP